MSTKRAKTPAKAAKAPVTAQSSLAELRAATAKKERVRAAVSSFYGIAGEALLEKMADPLLHRWTLEETEKQYQRSVELQRQMEAELVAEIGELRKWRDAMWREMMLALAMAQHWRLGAGSAAGALSPELAELVSEAV